MKCLLNFSPPALFGLRASQAREGRERERGARSALDIQSGFRKLMDGLTDECYGSFWMENVIQAWCDRTQLGPKEFVSGCVNSIHGR